MRSKTVCFLAVLTIVIQYSSTSAAQQLKNGGRYSGVRSRINHEMGVTRLRLAQLKNVHDELKVTPAQVIDLQKADIFLNGEPISGKMPTKSSVRFTGRKNTDSTQFQLAQRSSTLPPGLNVPGARNPNDVRDDFREKEMTSINEHVAKELDLLERILKKSQLKRLNQIYIQLRGAKVFLEKQIATQLSLTEEQVLNIYRVIEEFQGKMLLELQDHFKNNSVPFEGNNASSKRKDEYRTRATKDVLAILSKDQLKEYKAMRGKNFPFSKEMKTRVFGTLYD